MIAELGNFFVVVPYALITLAGVVFIMIAMNDRKKTPSVPNLTARRKHPLRHLQVEVNRARKEAREKARAKDEANTQANGQRNGEDKPSSPRPRRRGDGPPHLRRL